MNSSNPTDQTDITSMKLIHLALNVTFLIREKAGMEEHENPQYKNAKYQSFFNQNLQNKKSQFASNRDTRDRGGKKHYIGRGFN